MGTPNPNTGPTPIWPPPEEAEVTNVTTQKLNQGRGASVAAFALVVFSAVAGFAGRAMLAGALAAAGAVVVLAVIVILRPPQRRGERLPGAGEGGGGSRF